MWSYWLLILAVHFVYADAGGSNPFKLPKSVRPSHYDLTIKPDFYSNNPSQFRSSGEIIITADVTGDADSIKLHAVSLELDSVKILKNGKDLFRGKQYDSKFQWFTLSLKEKLKSGDKIKIQVQFSGPIDHSLFGLYYYSRRVSGGRRYGVTTQFEPTYARKAFPCFDEPLFKATFSISILRKSSYLSLSNTPLVSSQPQSGGWIKDTFDKSPRMSSYLVAIIVTQYKGLTEMHHNVNFTIYYPPGREQQVQVAMAVSKKVFSDLQDYFDIKYPIPKLDQIGFSQQDYKFGGMENYGMITYMDPYVYTNTKQKTVNTYLAAVVLHEVTHQWFGNLVTMTWWDDLWLNEGMTQFFSFLRGKWIEDFQPLVIGILEVLGAMEGETNRPSLPVTVPWLQSPGDVLSVINSITYSKGASVVKTAEKVMGEDHFRTAMREYMKQNQYKSVTELNLWDTLSKVSKRVGENLNMSRILDPWVTQPGFPVVSVKFTQNEIKFEQKVFYFTASELDANMKEKTPYKYRWPIPIQWKTGNKGKSKVVVSFEESGSVKLTERRAPNDWIVVNPEQNFYYIVQYETKHWKELAKHLRQDHLKFDEFTRGKLVFDLMLLYKATKNRKGNYVDANVVNEVLAYASGERSIFVLNVMWRYVSKLQDQELRATISRIPRRQRGKK